MIKEKQSNQKELEKQKVKENHKNLKKQIQNAFETHNYKVESEPHNLTDDPKSISNQYENILNLNEICISLDYMFERDINEILRTMIGKFIPDDMIKYVAHYGRQNRVMGVRIQFYG